MPAAATALTVLHLILGSDVVARDVGTASLPWAEVTRTVQAIWAPFVNVVIAAPTAIAGRAERLELRFSDAVPTPRTGEPAGALAWIDFVGGVPQPVITVSLARAHQVMRQASVYGRPVRDWPDAVRRRVLAAVVGRAIAHEVGHYLLQSPAHSSSGLMQARFLPQHFVDPGGDRFQLTAAEVLRLRARLSPPQWAEQDPGREPPGHATIRPDVTPSRPAAGSGVAAPALMP